jgi:hypothetical protein
MSTDVASNIKTNTGARQTTTMTPWQWPGRRRFELRYKLGGRLHCNDQQRNSSMTRYYFKANYRGEACIDDIGEELPTLQEARSHAAAVASELNRNALDLVTVYVVGADGAVLASETAGKMTSLTTSAINAGRLCPRCGAPMREVTHFSSSDDPALGTYECSKCGNLELVRDEEGI